VVEESKRSSETLWELYNPKVQRENLRTKTKTTTEAMTKRSGDYRKAMSEWTLIFFMDGACSDEDEVNRVSYRDSRPD
jgi:hypothetical protein